MVATKYLSRVLFRGLISFVKAYLHLAVAEAKFIFKLISAPWQNDRINLLKKATIELLTRIMQAFTPDWVYKVRGSPSRLGKLVQLLRVVRDLVIYIYSCALMKQLLVIVVSELLRMKRLVMQTVNRSRRLRIKDSTSEAEENAER